MESAHRYLESTFGEVADRAHRVGIRVQQEIIEGETPTQALASYAHDHGFDLIVCGHHDSRRAGRLLLRGVAQDLLEAAGTPVLVVSDQER